MYRVDYGSCSPIHLEGAFCWKAEVKRHTEPLKVSGNRGWCSPNWPRTHTKWPQERKHASPVMGGGWFAKGGQRTTSLHPGSPCWASVGRKKKLLWAGQAKAASWPSCDPPGSFHAWALRFWGLSDEDNSMRQERGQGAMQIEGHIKCSRSLVRITECKD